MRVSGLGLRVEELGLGVQGSGFRVQSLKCRVEPPNPTAKAAPGRAAATEAACREREKVLH